MKELDDELLDSLDKEEPLDHLLEIVRQFKQCGVSQRTVYEKLMAIWMRFGCGDESEQSPRCERIESLLEIVCETVRRSTRFGVLPCQLSQTSKASDFSSMHILADALEDAGGDSEDILRHCRERRKKRGKGSGLGRDS